MQDNLNVLIVDDSVMTRRMVARSLALCGFGIGEMHEAGDGQQALAVLRASPVDVVFADVNMPIMNGVEMVEHMVKDSALMRVPVVIVSTERSAPRMLRLRELGVRAYLHKPFTPEEFNSMLLEVFPGRAV
jgi:two-component system chemotaxis response regulator CheY